MGGSRDGDKMGIYDPRAPFNVSPIDWFDEVNRALWKDSFGSLKGTYTVATKHMSRRHSYERSPLRLVPGTLTIGRSPTPYSRVIFSQTDIQNVLTQARYGGVLGDSYENPLETSTFFSILGYLGVPKLPFWDNGNNLGYVKSDVDFENDRNRAITECLNKLGNNKVDVGVALAELTKTVTHLATTATDLWSAYDGLRNKDFRKVLRILSKRSTLHNRKVTVGKTAAQYWLEYNYAWRPLIQDAYGLYQLLNEQLKPALLVHASRTVANNHSIEGSDLVSPFPSQFTRRYSFNGKTRRRSTVRLTGMIDNERMRSVSQGMTNPAVVLWELVPYSFVLDWSIPIGSVLEAATATRGLKFVWGSITQRFQSHVYVEQRGIQDPALETVRPGYSEVSKYGMYREVLHAFPRPVLYSKTPFSSSHLVSATALFRQLI